MTKIVPFNFEGSDIRVVDIDGAPWFVGKDVAERLGYSNPTKAMNDHCKGVTKRYPLQTAGGMQEIRLLSEPDVLRLIVGSIARSFAIRRLFEALRHRLSNDRITSNNAIS